MIAGKHMGSVDYAGVAMILRKSIDLLQGFAAPDLTDPLVVKQEICRAAASGISSKDGLKLLYGDDLLVQLAVDKVQRPIFKAQLVNERTLELAVRSHLRQEGCADTHQLHVGIEFVDGLPSGSRFHLSWRRREVSARLTVLEGRASRKIYHLGSCARIIFIGRGSEVVDKHGFLVRRNNIVFDCTNDEINNSVSRCHGWLQFDPASQSFRLYDPESKHGTRIERDGLVRRISPNGAKLCDGDTIYLGRTKVRFTLNVIVNEK